MGCPLIAGGPGPSHTTVTVVRGSLVHRPSKNVIEKRFALPRISHAKLQTRAFTCEHMDPIMITCVLYKAHYKQVIKTQ
jgi:hypothetical protein